MQVKRFVAADMRRVLELVRQELGSDAIILSSRRVRDGVEILTSLAAPDASTASIAAPALGGNSAEPESSASASVFAAIGDAKPGLSGRDIHDEIAQASRQRLARQHVKASADEYLSDHQVVNAGIDMRSDGSAERRQSAAERYGLLDSHTPAPAPKDQPEIEQLHDEIAQMRELLEEQLSRLGGQPPNPNNGAPVTVLSRRFERMGIASHAYQPLLQPPLQSRLPAKAWAEAMARLAKAVPVMPQDPTAKGGVFALVGPTGAGKTTTVAKLAARYVMRHGADKVALVTTDTHRLAGHDQLRSLASILQVPLRVVDANNPLDSVLRSLRRCELVLIDTPGLRLGAPELKRQMAELARITNINSLLVLPANSQAQMLQASHHAYSGAGLSGCVLTKLDETASLGEAISCVIGNKLPIAYTTDGQDIPADIATARGHQLVASAVQLAQGNQGKRQAQGE